MPVLLAVVIFNIGGVFDSGASPEPGAASPSPMQEHTEKEPFIYNDYTISLEYFPDTRSVSGFERVQYKNDTGMPIHKVYFNLYFNAFDSENAYKPYFQSNYNTIFRHGEGYGKINVINTFINGEACQYSLNGTVLTVFFPFMLEKEQIASIDIVFEAQVSMISHRTGANGKAVWFGNFVPVLAVFDKTNLRWRTDPYYPSGKPFYSKIANYSVNITAPAGYSVIGAGDAAASEAGAKQTTTFTAKMVRDFAFAISNEYNESVYCSETGVYVTLYYFSDLSRQNLDYLSGVVMSGLDYFSETIGGYPYKTLKIAENGNYVNTAVYPQIIFLNTGSLQNDNLASTAVSLVTGVARQWFYGVVGNDQINEAWLSEGLSYYTAYSFLYRDDKESLNDIMYGLYLGLEAEYDSLKHTRISDDISVYDSNHAYNAIQSTKAALMFHSLRELTGSTVYGEFIKLYFRDNYLSTATTERLITAAETAYGQSLRDFFDLWLNDESLPGFPNMPGR